MKKRTVRPIIWRLFHRRKERFSSKAFRKLLDIHDLLLKIRAQMDNYNISIIEKPGQFTIEGQEYEAAVEKYTEFMMEDKMIKTEGIVELGEAPLTETSTTDEIPIVRCSKLPELLLLLGVRIED